MIGTPTSEGTNAPRRAATYRTQSLLSLSVYVATAVVLLVQIPVLTRALGADQYGTWVVSGGIGPYLLLFDLGLPHAINRYVARERMHRPRMAREAITLGLLSLFGIGVLAVIVAVIVAPYWARSLESESAQFGLIAGGIAGAFFLVARLFLSALEGSGAVSTSRIVQASVTIAFGFASVPIAIASEDKIRALSLLVVLQSLTLTTFGVVALRSVWNGRLPFARPSRITTYGVLKYGLTASVGGVLAFGSELIGRFVLAGVAGPASVAPLDIALRIRGQIFGAASAALAPMMPAAGELASGAEAAEHFRPLWRIVGPLFIAFSLGMSAIVYVVSPLLFGTEIGIHSRALSVVSIIALIPSQIVMLQFILMTVFGTARDLAYVYLCSLVSFIGVPFIWIGGAWTLIGFSGLAAVLGAGVTNERAKRRCGEAGLYWKHFHRGYLALSVFASLGVVCALAVPALSVWLRVAIGTTIWVSVTASIARVAFRALREPQREALEPRGVGV